MQMPQVTNERAGAVIFPLSLAVSLNAGLAKYREEKTVGITRFTYSLSLAFFTAILQDLMQDIAFCFANRCKCVL